MCNIPDLARDKNSAVGSGLSLIVRQTLLTRSGLTRLQLAAWSMDDKICPRRPESAGLRHWVAEQGSFSNPLITGQVRGLRIRMNSSIFKTEVTSDANN